jgi:hypothetical protein
LTPILESILKPILTVQDSFLTPNSGFIFEAQCIQFILHLLHLLPSTSSTSSTSYNFY